MRRLTAVLALASLANLMFAQGGLACSLKVGQAASAVVSGGHGEHAGHEAQATTAGSDVAEPGPGTDTTPAPTCLTMGPCALTLDLSGALFAAGTAERPDRVIGVSDLRPGSQATAPELPPPRA